MSTLTLSKPRLSVKAQTLFTIGAIVAAVAVPQLFHAVGAISGSGTALGATFLPMHLPIILVGLLAGPYAGLISGVLGPIASFLISGMPNEILLPFMCIELASYGLCAGLLRNVKMPSFGKVILTQLGGRAVRAVSVLIAVYFLGNSAVNVSTIWTTIIAGLPGIILQWVLFPLVIYRIKGMGKNER